MRSSEPGALDPRVSRGLAAQASRMRELEARGDRRIGWKVALNEPASLRRLGLEEGVVGFLVASSERKAAEPISLRGCRLPGIEAEVALQVGRDVSPDMSRRDLEGCVASLGLAAELVDMRDTRFDDAEAVVGRNVFHRAVVFAPPVVFAQPEVPEEVTAEGRRNGERRWKLRLGSVHDRVVAALAGVAGRVAALGATVSAGDRIISGSVAPVPIWVRPGDRVELDMGGLGRLELTFEE